MPVPPTSRIHYQMVVADHARNLVRQLPKPYLDQMHNGIPRGCGLRWPDDELSWLHSIVHQVAVTAVNPEAEFIRRILAASPNLDAFDPAGLMFDSSATMLKYIALYAYKADLWAALNDLTVAVVLDLINPPADAGKE